jgi:hypothetical protein
MHATHRRPSPVEPRIVVRGPSQPATVWPEERPLAAPVGERRAAEIGDPWGVVELLGRADGTDAWAYLATHGAEVASIRALTAHCAAAVLHAAVRVEGVLSPSAVLAALHEDLASRSDRRRELLDLLAS